MQAELNDYFSTCAKIKELWNKRGECLFNNIKKEITESDNQKSYNGFDITDEAYGYEVLGFQQEKHKICFYLYTNRTDPWIQIGFFTNNNENKVNFEQPNNNIKVIRDIENTLNKGKKDNENIKWKCTQNWYYTNIEIDKFKTFDEAKSKIVEVTQNVLKWLNDNGENPFQ